MMLQTRVARGLLGSIVILAATSACGDVVRQGRSPVVLVIDSLTGTVFSDVVTNVTTPAPCSTTTPCATIKSDSATAAFHVDPKDITIAPTTNNQVTIRRVRIVYRRADGRNTQGLDVPYAFDQGVTITVPEGGTATVSFEAVRQAAKLESPLVQLALNPNIIHAIAEVTFYGTDLVGNDISATGSMSVEFGNFADQ